MECRKGKERDVQVKTYKVQLRALERCPSWIADTKVQGQWIENKGTKEN